MHRSPSNHDPDFKAHLRQFDGFAIYHHLAAPTQWPNRVQDCIEVIVPLGHTVLQISWQGKQQESLILRSNAVGLIPPRQPHRLDLVESSELMILQLMPEFLNPSHPAVLQGKSWTLEGPQAIKDRLFQSAAHSLKRCLGQWPEAHQAIASYYCHSWFKLLSIHLLTHYAHVSLQELDATLNSAGKLGQSNLKALETYIATNLAQNLKVATLAKQAGVSPTHFRRLFKKLVGLSPHRYILLKRVEQAKFLLETTELGVTEIALQCGFYDQSHFIFQFRRFTGQTPKDYRG